MPSVTVARQFDWMNLKTNLVWIYDGAVYHAGRSGHFDNGFLSAWLIRKGEANLKAEGKKVHASAGEWLLPWPGNRHQSFSEGAELLSISFYAQWPDGRPFFDHGLSAVLPKEFAPRLEMRALRLLKATKPFLPSDPREFINSPISFDAFIRIKTALLQWLSAYYEAVSRMGIRPTRLDIQDERILESLRNLDGFSLDERFREADLATQCGLSLSQYVRIFREQVGQTPKAYFEQRRRDFARRMLSGSEIPIKQIALELGFIRLSDFSAWFKNFTGMSPRIFRQTVSKSG